VASDCKAFGNPFEYSIDELLSRFMYSSLTSFFNAATAVKIEIKFYVGAVIEQTIIHEQHRLTNMDSQPALRVRVIDHFYELVTQVFFFDGHKATYQANRPCLNPD
jgi:hypothetical protein